MLASAGLAVALAGACAFIHYEALSRLNALLPRVHSLRPRLKVLAAVAGALVSHLVQVGVFAVAYYVFPEASDAGGLAGEFDGSFMGCLYFSLQSYTSLGFGDVHPVGSLRLVAGVQALIGLLMIGWTASFTYLEMSRYWPDTRSK